MLDELSSSGSDVGVADVSSEMDVGSVLVSSGFDSPDPHAVSVEKHKIIASTIASFFISTPPVCKLVHKRPPL